MRAGLALSSACLLAGCHLYFGHDDDVRSCLGEDDCTSGETCQMGGECLRPPGCEPGEACIALCAGRCVPCTGTPLSLRNPQSGACESLVVGCEGAVALPDWAACDACAGLDEPSCAGRAGCRAIYFEGAEYAGCWGTAPSGPVQGGGCAALGAAECSRHDDCAAVHRPECGDGEGGCARVLGAFAACAEERRSCAAGCGDAEKCGAAGWCVPLTCADREGERACIEAACTPVYEGAGCTCDASGCSCAEWTFVSCGD